MSSLTEEISAYESMRRDLEINHLGKWVVVHGGKLVEVYDSFELAAEAAVEQFGSGPYPIRKVGAAPATFPASLLYRPAGRHVPGWVRISRSRHSYGTVRADPGGPDPLRSRLSGPKSGGDERKTRTPRPICLPWSMTARKN